MHQRHRDPGHVHLDARPEPQQLAAAPRRRARAGLIATPSHDSLRLSGALPHSRVTLFRSPQKKRSLPLGAAPSLPRAPRTGQKRRNENVYESHTFIGYLAKDAEARSNRNGLNFTVLTVATNASWKDRGWRLTVTERIPRNYCVGEVRRICGDAHQRHAPSGRRRTA